jgi:LDH2 family malate/lactate/ureidoglycolate dehydrogenase
MKITTSSLREKVVAYLLAKGLNDKDAHTLASLVFEQELIGNQFSAVGELPGKYAQLFDSNNFSNEEVVVAKPAAKLIKGNGRLAPLNYS